MSKNERSDKQSPGVVSARRGVAVVLALALVTGTALATVTLSRLASGGSAINPKQTASPASPARESLETATASNAIAPQATEDELQIELSTNGFAQTEVTRAAGTFAIAVDNRNVAEEYVLQLKGAGGVMLNEVRVQKGSTGWTVDLAPGTYTLMVANHPDWVCQITVQ